MYVNFFKKGVTESKIGNWKRFLLYRQGRTEIQTIISDFSRQRKGKDNEFTSIGLILAR